MQGQVGQRDENAFGRRVTNVPRGRCGPTQANSFLEMDFSRLSGREAAAISLRNHWNKAPPDRHLDRRSDITPKLLKDASLEQFRSKFHPSAAGVGESWPRSVSRVIGVG